MIFRVFSSNRNSKYFPGDDWPECVIGCVDFPAIENFKSTDRMFKLPNDTVMYDCAKTGLIPHTGENLNLLCLENGTFVPTTDIPKCVRSDTCRQPDFPTHINYDLYNDDKVAYNHDEYIQVSIIVSKGCVIPRR